MGRSSLMWVEERMGSEEVETQSLHIASFGEFCSERKQRNGVGPGEEYKM